MYPKGLRYTKDHEWVRPEGRTGWVGLTHYAQEQLGDIVYVELPEVGRFLKQGEVFGVVESVKAASDCYSPVGGTVKEVNQKLTESPQLVNADPYGEGWFFVLEMSDASDLDRLMDADAYEKHVREQEAAH